MSDLIKHLTKCRLCSKTFEAPALAVPIIGEPPHKNVERYMRILAKHIEETHQAEWGQLLGISSLFTVVLILRTFETADPALKRAEDINRFQVHQLTRRNPPPSDEGLKQNLLLHYEKPRGSNEDGSPILTEFDLSFRAMQELRDYLIEAAVFQPVTSETT